MARRLREVCRVGHKPAALPNRDVGSVRRPWYLDAVQADADALLEGGCDCRRALDALPSPLAMLGELEATGVPRAVLAELNAVKDLALARVSIGRDGLFEFGGPDRRFVLGVRNARHELVDIVALAPRDESQWALWRGAVDLLGQDAIDRAGVFGRDCAELRDRVWGTRWINLRVHATPIGWLRGAMRGVCVLSWTPAAVTALAGLGPHVTLLCEGGLQRELAARLARAHLPRVADASAEERGLSLAEKLGRRAAA